MSAGLANDTYGTVMLPSPAQVREVVRLVVADKHDQGHDTSGVHDALDQAGESLDALAALAESIADLPMRADWPYVEPVDLEAVRSESRPQRAPASPIDPSSAAPAIETAFLARVSGCVLGKPFELDLTLEHIRAALEPEGSWPLSDYPNLAVLDRLPMRIGQWAETARERIRWVAPDDDINYTIVGMLVLERHGLDFTVEHLRDVWLQQLPMAAVFGPERTMLVRAGMHGLDGGSPDAVASWANHLNPRDEWCGALIRADPYGYANPGDPETASALAWRDASFTHRRTGVYGSMFVAAALALAPVRDDPLGLFDDALAFVPGRSRFAEAVADALTEVDAASDWVDGYARIHRRWPGHTHCRIFQEVGTLVNSIVHARDAGEAICLQVMQGNDTDSYGATAGSIAGLLFGAGSLDPRWLAPFDDDLRTALALFHERSLGAVAARVARLPERARSPRRVDLPY